MKMMKDIITKLLLVVDKFMSELHFLAAWISTQCVDHIQTNKEERDSYIYQDKLSKTCFSAWYGLWRFEKFTGKNRLDRLCSNKAFSTANNLEYDGYKQRLTPMVHKLYDKKSQKIGIKSKAAVMCAALHADAADTAAPNQ